jgi:CRP-like cAMP-binding protein
LRTSAQRGSITAGSLLQVLGVSDMGTTAEPALRRDLPLAPAGQGTCVKAGITPDIIHGIYPLNQLDPRTLEELAPGLRIEELDAAHSLFEAGQKPAQLRYLLSGQVDLLDERQRLFMSVLPTARANAMPLPPLLPSMHYGRAAAPSRVLAVDRRLLYGVLFRHHPEIAQSADLSFSPDDDGTEATWQELFLRARGYRRIPRERLDVIFSRMHHVPKKAGEFVIRQEEPTSDFYVLAAGRCEVTHKVSGALSKLKLGEFGPGTSIGEDGLIAGEARNATVRMLTDGVVMRLEGELFRSMIMPALAVAAGPEQVAKLRSRGARWLDVRMPQDADQRRLRDAIRVPHPMVRARRFGPDPDQPYIVVSGSGRAAAVIAFMLCKFGLEAYYLAGGVAAVPAQEFAA